MMLWVSHPLLQFGDSWKWGTSPISYQEFFPSRSRWFHTVRTSSRQQTVALARKLRKSGIDILAGSTILSKSSALYL